MKQKKKLRILFVTNNYKPYSGGVVSSIESTQAALKREGHSVTIVTLDFTGEPEPNKNVIRIACPIKFLYKGNHMAVPLKIDKPLRKIFEQKRPDVVHLHHPFLLCVGALRIAKEKNIRTVFTHHTQYGKYAQLYAPIGKSFANKITAHYVRRFCNRVDALIAPSSSIAWQLKQQKITTPLTIIPSAIEPLFVHTTMPVKRAKSVLKLLTVARFRKEKNLFFILDALKKVQIPFEYTLIGYGDLEQELKTYAYNTCTLSKEQVKFVIRPSKKVIAQVYAAADLFLFASTTETQGLVFDEAMAAATPCIALKASGAKDCIRDHKNGLLVGSKKAMAQAIEVLYHNQKLYCELSKNAYEYSKKRTAKHFLRHLLQTYQDLVGPLERLEEYGP